MKPIILTASAISDFYFSPARLGWLGLKMVKKVLAEQGIESTLVLPFEKPPKKGTPLPLPQELSYLKPFLIPDERGPLAAFGQFQRLGPHPTEQAIALVALNPKIILISCFAFAYGDDSIALAKEIKRLNPAIKCIIGGAGVSVLPTYFQNIFFNEEKLFSIVIVGEIEGTIDEIKKVLHEPKTEIKTNTPTANLIRGINRQNPTPLISILPKRNNKIKLMTMLTRGCPKMCQFCSNHLTQGRHFRQVDENLFEKEMKKIQQELKQKGQICNEFDIEDDNLLINRPLFFKTVQKIHHFFPDAAILAENGLDYLLLEPDDLPILKAIGFKQLNFSLGSISHHQRAEQKRVGNPEKLKELSLAAKKLGIEIIIYFICGMAEDRPQDIIESFSFIAQCEATAGISLFYSVPGLPAFTDTTQFPLGTSHRCLGAAAYPWTGAFSTPQLLTAFRLSRLFNWGQKIKQNGLEGLKDEEKELYHQTLTEKRLYTLRKASKEKILPIEGLDNQLIYRFFNSNLL